MKPKHTPGPWRVGYAAFCVDAGPMKICDIRGWGHLTGTGGLNLPPEKAKAIQVANANLISAAPELLQVAKLILEEWEKPTEGVQRGELIARLSQYVDIAREAVKKAEGKQ